MFESGADGFGPGAFGFGTDGFDPDEKVDVINLKCDPIAAQSLHTRPGILPAYHMNHTQWITVLLDGTVPPEEIFPLIDMSYELTASKSKRPADGGPREWLVPSNPKFFDVIGAFEAEEEIDWKQSSAVHVGDTVYLYVGAPVSAILYRCTATKVNIPFFHQDENLTIRKLMRIRREHVYAREEFPIARLRDEFEVRSVRGPRGVPAELSEELKRAAGL
ncbi:MAG: MmcQ/YjbR family DNA-binding protein [Lachnospiraceae bacterium]|nr:MmcQ/YjbR family DNA-binding protein [Lachnospiraceae bacterium]